MNYVGRFADKSGRMIEVRQVEDDKLPFRIRVTLPNSLDQALRSHTDYPFEITDELCGHLQVDAAEGEFLQVEGGILKHMFLGPTLNLFPLSANQLKPAVYMGLYDDWDDDLGLPWAFPLSIYHRQAAA